MKNQTHVCLSCEQADMKKKTSNVTVRVGEFLMVVPNVYGWHCPHCGEVEFLDEDSSRRHFAAMSELFRLRDAAVGEQLRTTRKRLKLTRAQAADLTGDGHNAFSRYERGEVKPMPAVVNLFKLLGKHPELLEEVRS